MAPGAAAPALARAALLMLGAFTANAANAQTAAPTPGATAPTPDALQDAGPALPDWLAVGPPRPPSELAAAWDAVLRSGRPYMTEPVGVSTMAVRLSENPTAPLPYVELSADDGEYAGQWRFQAREGADLPHAAWRLVLSETPPYRVNVQIYCDDDAGDCLALRRELAQLLPPRPTQQANWAQWLRILTDGPCETGPVHMPAPRFPPMALVRGSEGVVRVALAFNACGEVRDAWVHQSSRSIMLDKAAVNAARRWRVALPADQPGPGQAVVSVRFGIEDDRLPDG
jgi:TonB family protein